MADKKYRDRYRARAKELGLCSSCFIRIPVLNRLRCAQCLEYAKQYSKKWRAKNPEAAKTANARCEARRPGRYAEIRRRYHARLRDGIFKKYGDRCNNPNCGWVNEDGTKGCTDRRALQVDHIQGGGTQERQQLLRSANTYWRHVLNDATGKFQLLCANCNSIKRHEKKEFFRHGRETS